MLRMMWRTPMMTQSVGVPFTAKWRREISRRRSGSLRESECETPLWSVSGATTQTSSESCSGDRFQDFQPGRVDAVVVGAQDAHDQACLSILTKPPM